MEQCIGEVKEDQPCHHCQTIKTGRWWQTASRPVSAGRGRIKSLGLNRHRRTAFKGGKSKGLGVSERCRPTTCCSRAVQARKYVASCWRPVTSTPSCACQPASYPIRCRRHVSPRWWPVLPSKPRAKDPQHHCRGGIFGGMPAQQVKQLVHLMRLPWHCFVVFRRSAPG